MAMAGPAPAAYDDGSSTESEYYFDPREEAEEGAALAWDTTQEAPNQPATTTVIKQEYRECGQLQQGAEEIALPQGSEWSHGAVATTVYDNAVERALAMARELTEAQGEEPLTDDTMNSNASPVQSKEEEKKTVPLKKAKEVKVKVQPKVVSLKALTPPTSVAKSVAVGLRRSPKKAAGEPSGLEKGLSVARSQWKASGSQATTSLKTSPSLSKAKPRNEHTSRNKKKWGIPQQDAQNIETGIEERRRGAALRVNTDCSANKSGLQNSEPLRLRQTISGKDTRSTVNNPTVVKSARRSPRDSRIRPRVEPVAAPRDNGKTPAYENSDHFDAFQRRVFKLKLQEADADEKLSRGPLNVSEKALFERRINKISVERARLEAQDLERFEKVHATTKVSPAALKRYQDNRDFAWRVICFKQRQASLQMQNTLFVSEEAKKEKWRRLDEVREKLLAENSFMFHKVMMENDGEFQHRLNANANTSRRPGKRAVGGDMQQGRPTFKRRVSGATPVAQFHASDSTTNSRVVIGAALQLQGDVAGSDTFHNNN
ncbi:hypothetical protein PHYPSEUDO_012696 [Phytophthora pseudosyringae]|uniref:Uncharacterized protein n=1 Tax=Phytophthora pseudosyringae TaxID=221518 RepID=A0A8T1V753_9STRA|nr:hypothetical protein PHYPSEUDO_012696 [Phytophthora pseudosyringae]